MILPQYQRQGYGAFLIDFSKLCKSKHVIYYCYYVMQSWSTLLNRWSASEATALHSLTQAMLDLINWDLTFSAHDGEDHFVHIAGMYL